MLQHVTEKYQEEEIIITDGGCYSIVGLNGNGLNHINSTENRFGLDEGDSEYEEAVELFYFNYRNIHETEEAPLWASYNFD